MLPKLRKTYGPNSTQRALSAWAEVWAWVEWPRQSRTGRGCRVVLKTRISTSEFRRFRIPPKRFSYQVIGSAVKIWSLHHCCLVAKSGVFHTSEGTPLSMSHSIRKCVFIALYQFLRQPGELNLNWVRFSGGKLWRKEEQGRTQLFKCKNKEWNWWGAWLHLSWLHS